MTVETWLSLLIPHYCASIMLQDLLRIDIYFMEIDHIVFSTVILSLWLIQEEQLSVSGERMCTNTG